MVLFLNTLTELRDFSTKAFISFSFASVYPLRLRDRALLFDFFPYFLIKLKDFLLIKLLVFFLPFSVKI